MSNYKEFPEGDGFWLVKWIDEFRIPYGRTRSADVRVQLIQIPIESAASISRLTPLEVQRLLNLKAPKANDTSGGSSNSSDTTGALFANINSMKIPCVFVGSIPDLQVGQVFHQKARVGTLPTARRVIALAKAEDSCREITIGDSLLPPEGWEKRFPYRILNPSEYTDVQKLFEQSRCLVYSADDIDYVIPRTVIFKTFYAQSTYIANAISSGPWHEASKHLVYEGKLDSGLETGIDKATGQWNVILQSKVDKEHAFLMALYRFDPHANLCITAIHTRALKDRNGRVSAPWFASACIPFKETDKPLRLVVHGYLLKQPYKGRQRFLVTAISESRCPDYIPDIGWEKFNSGESSDNPSENIEKEPYRKRDSQRPTDSDHTVTTGEDANPERQAVFDLGNSFQWSNPPKTTKLKKSSNKQYPGAKPLPPLDKTGEGSTGFDTGSQYGLTPTNQRLLIRDPVKRFEHLMTVMQSLKASGFIDQFYAVQPIHDSLKATRGGIPCWNFLNDEARRTGKWPTKGWELLSRGKPGTAQTSAVPRSALILAIQRAGFFGFWIEIECRATDGGFTSPLITGISYTNRSQLPYILESIANANGSNLAQAIKNNHEGLSVDTFRHQFKSNVNGHLDEAAVKRFLAKNMAE
jgi:hypothetical protein